MSLKEKMYSSRKPIHRYTTYEVVFPVSLRGSATAVAMIRSTFAFFARPSCDSSRARRRKNVLCVFDFLSINLVIKLIFKRSARATAKLRARATADKNSKALDIF